MTAYFDCETSALSDSALERVKPCFEAPAHYKDPVKIAESVAQQERTWKERASLDAVTAQILCIGTLENNIFTAIEGDEGQILHRFWEWLELRHLQHGHEVIGFSIFHFDLPFLVRRSWINGVPVPSIARRSNKWQPWNEYLIDIAVQWQCGNRDQTVKLDTLAKSLGIGAKTGTGKDFAATYATDRAKALEYLHNDLQLTRKCYERMNGLTTLPTLKTIDTELKEITQ